MLVQSGENVEGAADREAQDGQVFVAVSSVYNRTQTTIAETFRIGHDVVPKSSNPGCAVRTGEARRSFTELE